MSNQENDARPISIFEEIFPGDTNAYGTAFGGKILSFMDRAAGLAASRYAQCNFVTVSLDSIEFKAPVIQGEIAEVVAKVVYTSEHTCGVKVCVYAVEKANWKRRECCEGVFFMVGVDQDNKKMKIPMFSPASEDEQAEWKWARNIHKNMLRK